MPPRCTKFPGPALCGSASQQVPRQEEDIGRPFRQPPHKIWIPRLAVRNVEPQSVSFVNQLPLDVAADAIEHLEFEGVARDLARLHEALGLLDDPLVMRRYSRIDAGLEE